MTSAQTRRKIVRRRDGQKCVRCGMTNLEHRRRFGRQLQVHRVVAESNYQEKECILLCEYCHYKEHKKCRRGPDPEEIARRRAWGANLKRLRQAYQRGRRKPGVTKKWLRNSTGVSLAVLQNWEDGFRDPRISVAVLVAEALGVTPNELFELKKE